MACSPEESDNARELPRHIEPITATGELDLSTGQTVYVPAYSQIDSGQSGPSGKQQGLNFAVTLSIRNTDARHPIIIKSATYYDDDGTRLKEYVETPFKLAPMASTAFNIRQDDESGGIGANFIVKWGAEQTVFEPYIIPPLTPACRPVAAP